MKLALSSSILFLCLTWCYGQQSIKPQQVQNVERKAFVDSVKSLRDSLNIIQYKLDLLIKNHQGLKDAHDTLTKYVDDRRLRESLRSAESTINTQNSWMTGFGTIYAIITIVFGVITIILSLQAKDAIKKSDDATDRLIERTDYFNNTIGKEISKKLNVYKREFEKTSMDNLFRNLSSNLPQTRALAYEQLSALEKDRLTDEYVVRLFDLLNNYLNKMEKAIVVEKLIAIHDNQNLSHEN